MIELPYGVTLIAAIGKAGQLGLRHDLPWPHDKEDMKWFQQVTKAADVCIAGYNTAKTLPDLPGRKLVVDDNMGTAQSYLDLCEFWYGWVPSKMKIVVIGGAKTYKRWMPLARTVLLTKIDYDGPADTWMPPIWPSEQ